MKDLIDAIQELVKAERNDFSENLTKRFIRQRQSITMEDGEPKHSVMKFEQKGLAYMREALEGLESLKKFYQECADSRQAEDAAVKFKAVYQE